MAVFELSYRRLAERPAVRPDVARAIALSDLRVLHRRRALRMAVALLGFIALSLTGYVVVRSGVFQDYLPWLPVKQLPPVDAQFFAERVWSGFFHFLLVLLALLGGSGRIAEDLRCNALSIYLAKPVSRDGYLLGKVMATATVVGIGALGVPLLVFVVAALVDPAFLAGNLRSGLALVALGLVATAYHSSAILFFSSLVRSGRLAGLLFGGFYFVSGAVRESLGVAFRSTRFSFLGYRANLETLADHLLGTVGPDGPSLAPALLVIATVTLGGLALARRRIRAVEVVR